MGDYLNFFVTHLLISGSCFFFFFKFRICYSGSNLGTPIRVCMCVQVGFLIILLDLSLLVYIRILDFWLIKCFEVKSGWILRTGSVLWGNKLRLFMDVCSFLAEKCYWVAWNRIIWSAFSKGFWLIRLLGLKVWNLSGLVKHGLITIIRLVLKSSPFAFHCCIFCLTVCLINFRKRNLLVMNKWFMTLYLREIVSVYDLVHCLGWESGDSTEMALLYSGEIKFHYAVSSLY